MRRLIAIRLRRALSLISGATAAVHRDLLAIEFTGDRARQTSITTLSVVLSVVIACAMHLPDVWWAAISGFMSTQPTRPASIHKAALRVVGTAAGATMGLVLISWIAYDHFACLLVLFASATLGILGLTVSPHGYAWLFASITFSLVVLMSLADPTLAIGIAFFRALEVLIGSAVAVTIAIAVQDVGQETHVPPPPGWRDLFGHSWPAVLHALRGGVAVAMIPIAWSQFDLPDITAMAITMAAVLAVPVLADHPLDPDRHIVERAFQRLLGCFIGGLPALALLVLPLSEFLPWLLALAAGTWLFTYLQGNTRGFAYVGTQATLVFMMTLVQGEGPPASIMPGINRFVGILLGVSTLFVVCLILRLPKPGAEISRSPA